MTEYSWPWSTVAALGDGATTLSEARSREVLATYFKVQDPAVEGVSKGVLGELAVTGTASPVSVAAGSGVCYGLYVNDAAKTLAITTPAVGTTGFRVVMQTNWAGTGGAGLEARTRLAVKKNTDGVAAIPALTQTVGVTWEISLATGTITTGGVITVTDARVYRRSTAVVGPGELENRTQKMLVVPFADAGGTGGMSLPDAAITSTGKGRFMVPMDYLSGLRIRPHIGASGSGNIVYTQNYFTIRVGGSGPTATVTNVVEAVVAGEVLLVGQTVGATPLPGDLIEINFTRDAVNVLDTINAAVTFRGWQVDYLADH